MKKKAEWPKLDPLTNRKICEACWNGVHNKRDYRDKLVDNCSGPCDCAHLEDDKAQIEKRKKKSVATKVKKSLMREMRDDPSNPLRAENPNFREKIRYRTGA